MYFSPIDANSIRELFTYRDGALYWAVRNNPRIKVGDVSGGLDNSSGRWEVRIAGKNYKRSRLVWAFHNGDPGELQIDHINGDKTDDRIDNLRAVSASINSHNKGVTKANTTGIKGVSIYRQTKKGKYYRARLEVNGKEYRKFGYDLDCLIEWREEIARNSGIEKIN